MGLGLDPHEPGWEPALLPIAAMLLGAGLHRTIPLLSPVLAYIFSWRLFEHSRWRALAIEFEFSPEYQLFRGYLNSNPLARSKRRRGPPASAAIQAMVESSVAASMMPVRSRAPRSQTSTSAPGSLRQLSNLMKVIGYLTWVETKGAGRGASDALGY
jgi:hypothetical protein